MAAIVNPAVMQQMTFHLVGEMSTFVDKEIKKSQIPFAHCYSHAIAIGKSSWVGPTQFHQRFQQLYARHIANFSQTIQWSTSLKVLELGAGYLSEGRSRLSRCLPDEAQICYTDLSKKTFEDAQKKFPAIPYLHLNSSSMPEIESESQDVVVSSCFLDTLRSEELTSTLTEIFRILKPGGTLFHISDLEPYISTLVIDNKDNPGIMFPCLADDLFTTGIQFVPREVCEQFITTYSNHESLFLRNYIHLTQDSRAAVVIEICTVKPCAFTLSNWVKHHFSSSITEIVNQQFFGKRLKEGLEITQFVVDTLKNSFESSMYTKEEAGETRYNDISSFHGRVISKNVPDRDYVKKTLGAHLLIARKALPSTPSFT